MGFFKDVHEVVNKIPEGRVMSYSDVAAALDRPNKHKMVGIAMKFCPTSYAWHRVVKDSGKMVTGALQAMVLVKEGVPFAAEGYVDLEKCRFKAEQMQLLLAGASFETLPDGEE